MALGEGQFFQFEQRLSDSPLVERVWRTRSERPGEFMSLAASQRELVVMRHNGRLTLTLRPPGTRAAMTHCAIEAEWFGIILRLGAYLPHLPVGDQPDGSLDLPGAADRSFWLQGAAWEYPTYDNADAFVARLVREGLLVCDPVVAAALRRERQALSPRRVQHRFVRATGLSLGTIRQIERARRATLLLQQGVPIIETALRAGYADQAHLTRSLRRFIGQTPSRLLDPDRAAPTSLLFKTAEVPDAMMDHGLVAEPGGHSLAADGAGWQRWARTGSAR